ncbi:MAG TPA: cytochrome c oxidase assembly protein [Pararhizobium sp.]|jgi:cytochrome c oxidase assembly protein subunit 11|nr:cytochrome c oxidase assembly protein [Pararhizobium sp.]
MPDAEELKRRNRAVAGAAAGMVVVMFGLVAMSPIFYRHFSTLLGYGASLPEAETTRSIFGGGIDGKSVTVNFDTNVADGLKLEFVPEKPSVETTIGRPTKLYYDLTNNSGKPVVIRADFDVTPDWAAPYFFKATKSLDAIERLDAGETARVPLVFYVDRRILGDRLAGNVRQLTLSYTLFRQKGFSSAAVSSIKDLRDQSAAFDLHLERTGEATFANDTGGE